MAPTSAKVMRLAALAAFALFCALPAYAVDGVVLITQAKATAGGVTPGDTPGFPVTISAGGSYRLASNLAVPLGLDGIVVNGIQVTIDLNGFRITGGGIGSGGNGIVGNQRDLTIHGGTINAFGLTGIFAPDYLDVENMHIEDNGTAGIYAQGDSSRIVNNIVSFNGASGILCNRSCLVQNNMVLKNGATGVLVGNGSIVMGNSIVANQELGVAVSGGGKAGYGNNTIIDNVGGPVGSYMIRFGSNACAPTSC